jgi:hypothetical protein
VKLSTILWGAFITFAAYYLGRLQVRRKGFVLISYALQEEAPQPLPCSGCLPNYAERFPAQTKETLYITADGGYLRWEKDRTRALKLATREDADQLCTIVEDAEHIREVQL